MMTNVISVTAYLIDGTEYQLLTHAPPEVALAEYLCPDVHPPVKTFTIDALTNDGKRIKLHLSHGRIEASIENG